MTDPLTGLACLAALAIVFTAGVLLGRAVGAQRRVDQLLARETRRYTPKHAADGAQLGITAGEAMAGAKDLSAALRAEKLPRIPTRLVEQAAANGRCAMPVTTSMGPAVCLMHPGHAGGCQ